MNVRHVIVSTLALALLTAGISGCRSSKKQAAQQAPVARQSAPVYRTPPATYPQSPVAAYPAPPPPAQPRMPSQMPSSPMPPSFAGSPDGAVTGGFPDPNGFSGMQPTQPSAVSPGVADAIAQERDARMRIDQQIVDLEEKLRRVEMTANAPPATTPARVPAGGSQQATHFAASIQGKTSGEVEIAGSRVIIRLADAFQPGSEKLKTNAALTATLLATAQELSKHPGARIEVVGHSDGTPLKVTKSKWRDNVHLSRERARTVASTLSKHGVSAGRIAVDGRGSVEPLIFPEKTAKDRARNRRVEVVILF